MQMLPSLLPLLQIIPLVTTRSKWGRLLIVRKEIPFRAISLLLLFCSNLNANKNFLRMQTSNLEESFETTNCKNLQSKPIARCAGCFHLLRHIPGHISPSPYCLLNGDFFHINRQNAFSFHKIAWYPLTRQGKTTIEVIKYVSGKRIF